MSVVLTDSDPVVEPVAQELPPLDVRVAAMEQALRFTMENIQVRINLPSPIVGMAPQVINTNLYKVYLEQLTKIRAMQQEPTNG